MFTESLTQFGRRSFAKLAAAGAVMALTGTGALAQVDAADATKLTAPLQVGLEIEKDAGNSLFAQLAGERGKSIAEISKNGLVG